MRKECLCCGLMRENFVGELCVLCAYGYGGSRAKEVKPSGEDLAHMERERDRYEKENKE